MVSIFSLWLPILLSGVMVFILSSIIHMALRYHSTDFVAVPDEDGVQDALRQRSLPVTAKVESLCAVTDLCIYSRKQGIHVLEVTEE